MEDVRDETNHLASVVHAFDETTHRREEILVLAPVPSSWETAPAPRAFSDNASFLSTPLANQCSEQMLDCSGLAFANSSNSDAVAERANAEEQPHGPIF